MKKKRGLSLIELLVVVFFLSIVLTMAITIGRSVTQKSYFSGGVNKFVSDFAYAKQVAARENRLVTVNFNSNGRSYDIRRQNRIGDLTQWTGIKSTEAMDGKVFFDAGTVQDFAVNSMGEVFQYPLAADPQPVQLSLGFFIRNQSGGTDYQANVIIFGYGGIKVED